MGECWTRYYLCVLLYVCGRVLDALLSMCPTVCVRDECWTRYYLCVLLYVLGRVLDALLSMCPTVCASYSTCYHDAIHNLSHHLLEIQFMNTMHQGITNELITG